MPPWLLEAVALIVGLILSLWKLWGLVHHDSRLHASLRLQESRQWEEPPGTDIQAYDAEAAAARQALTGDTPDVDYYAVLEVTRDVDAATLKRQYYMLARKWHPDKNKDNPDATKHFQQLGEAYQVHRLWVSVMEAC